MSEGTPTEIRADSLTSSAHSERYVNSPLLHVQPSWSTGSEKFESATVCVRVPFYVCQLTLWLGALLQSSFQPEWPILPVKIFRCPEYMSFVVNCGFLQF